jgi:hypothetical protein
LYIDFTVGISCERAATLTEKNAAAGLSDFFYSTWCRAAFFSASGAALSQEIPTKNE